MPQPTTVGRALAMVAAVAHFMLLHLRAAMRAGHTAQWWAHYCWLSMFGLCQLELPYGITSCSLLCMQAQYVPCAAVHNVGSPWAGRLTCCLKQTEVHAIPAMQRRISFLSVAGRSCVHCGLCHRRTWVCRPSIECAGKGIASCMHSLFDFESWHLIPTTAAQCMCTATGSLAFTGS